MVCTGGFAVVPGVGAGPADAVAGAVGAGADVVRGTSAVCPALGPGLFGAPPELLSPLNWVVAGGGGGDSGAGALLPLPLPL